MIWSVKSNYKDANHNPVAVVNGDASKNVVRLKAPGGGKVALSAEGSSDPDGDSLKYEWIVYEEGPTVRESRIVHRRNGKGNDPARTLCEWVGPADSGIPMFRLVTGVSVALAAHIGDPAVGSAERDTTGPGRQGMDVVVIGACRNLKRKL